MSGGPSDWQTGCNKLIERGAFLLQSGQWADCSFLVGTEPHQMLMKGHKLILAMASPVFEAMFYGGMAERNDPIPILDVQPEAFRALLEYVYTEKISIMSFDKACELCYAGKKYMLPYLVKECTKYLWADLYPHNACRAYEFAMLFEENTLVAKSLQIISTNTLEIINDPSFEEAELSTVVKICSMDYLNIECELTLFEAVQRFAIAYEKRKTESFGSPAFVRSSSPQPSTSKVVNVDSSSAESSPEASTEPSKAGDGAAQSAAQPQPGSAMEIPEPARNDGGGGGGGGKPEQLTVRAALQQLRFLTLTPQQFAEGPARSPLLTHAESFAVLMNILSRSADVPMPAGFSASRERRRLLVGDHYRQRAMAPLTVDTPSPVAVEQVFGAADAFRPPVAAPAAEDAPRGVNFPTARPPRNDESRLPLGLFARPSSSSWGAPPPDWVDAARPEAVAAPRPEVRVCAFAEAGAEAGAGAAAGSGAGADYSKIYCTRPIIHHTDCLNTSVLDCSVTFMVDKNICLLGVQVPTQAPSEGCAGGAGGAGAGAGRAGGGGGGGGEYSELLYAHLLDADGSRLTYTHYTNRVRCRRLLDIMFNRPVYIQRNKVYRVGIVFNKVGWYPMGTCAQQVAADSVFFHFGIGQSSDSVRDGLIRSIIFTY